MRPRNALFGYVCNPPGEPMTPADALAIVRNIRVDPSAAWAAVRQQDWSGDAGALSLARGSDDRGNPAFPFRLARFYVVGNGRGGFE